MPLFCSGSSVDADSFWVDGYFEETALKFIHDGDPATIWLLGYREVLQGHVEGVARGIVVSNATPEKSGLANVNPIFTWVQLAQRVPVRIHLDAIPPDVRLVVGMTATVEIHPKPASASGAPTAAAVKPNRPRQRRRRWTRCMIPILTAVRPRAADKKPGKASLAPPQPS